VLTAALVAGWSLGTPNGARWHLLAAYLVQWPAFAVAAAAVRRVPADRAVPWILAGGAALQLLAVLWPPRTTDDFFRYIWDGRVQAAGTDPYRYPPTDARLAGLRDGYLFPGDHPVLNHPGVRTIYPPVAQAYFLLLHYAPGERARPLQLAAALLAVVTSVLLVRLLRRTGGDPRAAVLWAWCPTVVLEAGNDAHVDVLGAFCAVAALTVLAGAHKTGRTQHTGRTRTTAQVGTTGGTRTTGRAGTPGRTPTTGQAGTTGGTRTTGRAGTSGRTPTTGQAGITRGTRTTGRAGTSGRTPTIGRVVAAGGLLGAAVGVKFLPALVAPALARHPRRWLLGAAAAGLLAVAYLPHLLAVGPGVLGFLGGYLGEEQYAGAARYPLLGLLPATAAPALAAVLVAGTALLVARRADPDRPAAGAAAMVGVTFCVVAPEYPWYALLLVALLAAADRPRWLPVAAAAWPAYLVGPLHWSHTATRAAGYGLAAGAVAAVACWRRSGGRRPDPRACWQALTARGRLVRAGSGRP